MTVYKIFDCHNEYKIVSTTPSSVARQLGDMDLIEKIFVQPLENFSFKSIWGEVDIEFEDVLKKDSLLPDISLWLRVFLVLCPKAYASLKSSQNLRVIIQSHKLKNCFILIIRSKASLYAL